MNAPKSLLTKDKVALNQVLGEMMHNMGQKWRGSDISLQAEGAVITLLAGIQAVHGHGKRLAESHDWVKNQGSPTCMLRMMGLQTGGRRGKVQH